MMRIEHYLENVSPFNILQVIHPEVLKNLLSGYSYALGSEISIVYPTELPVVESNLDRLTALDERAPETFNQLCACWRRDRNGKQGCGRNEDCEHTDNRVSLDYLRQKWTLPTIYWCDSLRLLEMAFPLRIEHRIVGVLFGGQIIVPGNKIDWGGVFQGFFSNFQGFNDLVVDWSSVRMRHYRRRIPSSSMTVPSSIPSVLCWTISLASSPTFAAVLASGPRAPPSR